MRADLTSEQTMLKDMTTRLLADVYDFETRRRVQATPDGWSRELWGAMAELGLLAALAPEALGGLGGRGVETMLIAEALGASLSAEPYLPTVVMAGGVLAALEHPRLEAVLAGEATIAWIGDGVRMTGGDSPRLDGVVLSATWAGVVDQLLVLVSAEDGPALVLIDPDRPGVILDRHRTFDGLPAADVRFEDAAVSPDEIIATGPEAERLAERANQAALAYLAGEGLGLMQSVMDATVEHLKSRRQFGQPLAAFQALQHRAAEMLVALEHGRSAAILAAIALDEEDRLERRKLFAAVKFALSESAHAVAAGGVQLHGGIGVTEEHRVGWAFRRLTMIELLHGDADVQASLLADLGGFVTPD